ncbi:MAG: DUF6036 family nucleotidyltransferase [Cyanobacteria bacterium P01_G01_bin.39]
MLYTHTAFSQAILEMFENLDSYLSQSYSNLPENAVSVYIFGGCAMHMHTGTRTSNDVDAELQSVKELKPVNSIEKAIQSVDFDDEDGFPRSLDWDGGFSPSIASIAAGYEERATQIHTTKSKLVSIYLVSAVDIAVSKIGRLETVDCQDIKSLYRNRLFTLEEFRETAAIARDYCTTAINKLEFNIKMAINILEEEI